MMLAAETLLVLLGLVGVVYGIYALVRGGRNQEGGGLGPVTERHPHGGRHQDADRRRGDHLSGWGSDTCLPLRLTCNPRTSDTT